LVRASCTTTANGVDETSLSLTIRPRNAGVPIVRA
jgi:hypothetical protein